MAEEGKVEFSEAEQFVMKAFNRARQTEKWFVAIWAEDGRGQLHRQMRTSEFPIHCFGQCLKDMEEFINQEVPERVADELPEAELFSMFTGEQDPDDD